MVESWNVGVARTEPTRCDWLHRVWELMGCVSFSIVYRNDAWLASFASSPTGLHQQYSFHKPWHRCFQFRHSGRLVVFPIGCGNQNFHISCTSCDSYYNAMMQFIYLVLASLKVEWISMESWSLWRWKRQEQTESKRFAIAHTHTRCSSPIPFASKATCGCICCEIWLVSEKQKLQGIQDGGKRKRKYSTIDSPCGVWMSRRPT